MPTAPQEQVIGGGTTAPTVAGGDKMRTSGTYTKPDNTQLVWRRSYQPNRPRKGGDRSDWVWQLYDSKGKPASQAQIDAYLKTHPTSTATQPGSADLKSTNTELRNRYLWNFFGRDQDRRIKQNASRERTLQKMQTEQDTMRDTALRNLDLAYADPSRQALRDQQYQSELDSALSGLSENYRDTRRRAALDIGRRGLAGGSHDAETRANLASAYQGNAMDVTRTALLRREDLERSDRDQYANLRRSILVGDPQEAARYAAMAGNESAAANRTSRLGDFYDTYRDINMQQADNMSRMYGGLASSIGNSYEIDQEAKGRGKRGIY